MRKITYECEACGRTIPAYPDHPDHSSTEKFMAQVKDHRFVSVTVTMHYVQASPDPHAEGQAAHSDPLDSETREVHVCPGCFANKPASEYMRRVLREHLR